MKKILLTGLLLAALSLAACTSYPLGKITHDKTAASETARTGQISLTSGKVTGNYGPMTVPTGGAFVTVPSFSNPDWANFNTQDQGLFIGYLADELQRLNILTPSQGGPADIALNVQFNNTYKAGNNDIYLDVTLAITTANGNSSKNYKVQAFEGGDYWTRVNTTLTTSKKMAAQKLMDAMIPDIQTAASALGGKS